ncbi:MAG: hypothetical protein KME26_07995 [Oscillatoria princeps RMCB-10]|nr:hypothetical protein [Oscillatoria princeps RMCB-10]
MLTGLAALLFSSTVETRHVASLHLNGYCRRMGLPFPPALDRRRCTKAG